MLLSVFFCFLGLHYKTIATYLVSCLALGHPSLELLLFWVIFHEFVAKRPRKVQGQKYQSKQNVKHVTENVYGLA